MALVQRKFTDLPGASALGASDIIPIVTSPTNVNKKITGQVLIDSLTTSSLPPLTTYLVDNNLIVDASILNPDNFIKPIQNDAVERIRVANPESLIDTDFEYSLQSSKWETLQLINNTPSTFTRSNEPSFTSEQIKTITKTTEPTVLINTSSSSSVYDDPRATRNGPLTAGWTALYEGGLQDVYDNYGNFIETIDSVMNYYEHLLINTGYSTTYFGTSYPTIVFGGGRAGVGFTQGYYYYGVHTNVQFSGATNLGIWVTSAGVSASPSGSLPVWSIKRVYTRTENLNTANERKVYLVYGFEGNVTDFYYNDPVPNRYNNYGYENAKYIIYVYRFNLNKIELQTLSGSGPGGNRFVLAQYPYSPTVAIAVNYPESSYSPYDLNRLYSCSTVLTQNNLRIETNVTPAPLLSAGSPIVLRETTDPANVDGSGIVTRIVTQGTAGTSTPAAFIVSMPRVGSDSLSIAPSGYKTQYTTIYTGGFYTGAEIPITSLSGLSGTTTIRATTLTPKKFFVNQPIYLVSTQSSTDTQFGAFTINSVNSEDSSFTYSNTNALTAYAQNTNLFSAAARLYVRPSGVALHRSADGGVQINPGDFAPYTQIIRQTRKYFRYQSGKSILFSTGLLFKPSYDIQNITVSTSLFNPISFPFYTASIITEQDHGFTGQSDYTTGTRIKISGLEVLLNPNPYNGIYNVGSVLNNKTFTVNIPVSSLDTAPVDLSPGGLGKIEAQNWFDCVVRSGMFDEQNGIFFQYDGQNFSIGKRDSTLNLLGTVSPVANNSIISGTGTKFITQLDAGDYVVIKGMSYKVDRVISDNSIQISPDYRGPSTSFVKMAKTTERLVNQTDFNLDKLDGTGPSGYVIDLSKMQMIYFDYSWYGAGRIRWGMRATNGDIIYCHEMPNNNVNTEAYMRSGNLPARFEILTLPKRGILYQANNMEVQYNSSSQVTPVTATLKRSTDFINYYNLVPPVSSVITPSTTTTFTVTSNNIDTFYDYKLFNSSGIDLPTDNFALSSSNLFRINSLTNIPLSGKLNIINEDLNYSVLNSSNTPVENKLIRVSRNIGNVPTISKINIGRRNALSVNQNCAPALSHWGTSVIMDGRFDMDKSYLFTAINRNTVTVGTTVDVPLISVRLAPSVDTGLVGGLGVRNLINRSFLSLKNLGIITNNTLNITVKLNCMTTLFDTLSNFQNVGTGSIAQYIDHSVVGITPVPIGGDTILSFYANEQSTGRFQVTPVDIDSIRELSNSILGGSNNYPDGPDVLTILARANTASSTVRGRVSWTEAQG